MTPSQSEIGRSVRLGIISTLCGEVSIDPGDVRVRSRVVGIIYVCVDGLRSWNGALSSPDDGYFYVRSPANERPAMK